MNNSDFISEERGVKRPREYELEDRDTSKKPRVEKPSSEKLLYNIHDIASRDLRFLVDNQTELKKMVRDVKEIKQRPKQLSEDFDRILEKIRYNQNFDSLIFDMEFIVNEGRNQLQNFLKIDDNTAQNLNDRQLAEILKSRANSLQNVTELALEWDRFPELGPDAPGILLTYFPRTTPYIFHDMPERVCDRTLVLEYTSEDGLEIQEKLSVSKDFLIKYFSFFKHMFHSNLSETNAKEIVIKDIEPQIFKKYLEFLTSNSLFKLQIGDMNLDEILKLVACIDRLNPRDERDLEVISDNFNETGHVTIYVDPVARINTFLIDHIKRYLMAKKEEILFQQDISPRKVLEILHDNFETSSGLDKFGTLKSTFGDLAREVHKRLSQDKLKNKEEIVKVEKFLTETLGLPIKGPFELSLSNPLLEDNYGFFFGEQGREK